MTFHKSRVKCSTFSLCCRLSAALCFNSTNLHLIDDKQHSKHSKQVKASAASLSPVVEACRLKKKSLCFVSCQMSVTNYDLILNHNPPPPTVKQLGFGTTRHSAAVPKRLNHENHCGCKRSSKPLFTGAKLSSYFCFLGYFVLHIPESFTRQPGLDWGFVVLNKRARGLIKKHMDILSMVKGELQWSFMKR